MLQKLAALARHSYVWIREHAATATPKVLNYGTAAAAAFYEYMHHPFRRTVSRFRGTNEQLADWNDLLCRIEELRERVEALARRYEPPK